MPLNHYLTLGRSGLRVSPLCLGAMTFGLDWGWGSDVDASKKIMDAYIERGGNFIDTANIYTKGHSEKIIGDHVGRDPRRRARLVLATKFMGNLFPGDPNAGGAHRKGIISACEESLRRLQTDYIDLYWMHFMDRLTPMDETMRALDDLVRSGKIRYVGFSDTPAWKCAQAQSLADFKNWSPIVALQIEYSLIERTVEGELVPMARELGMGITPWSPLKGGILSGKYTRETKPTEGRALSPWVLNHLNEKAYLIIDALISIAAEVSATPAQVALAWVNNKPGVVSSILGARTLEQLNDNLGALEVRLTADHIRKLDDLSQPKLNFPHDFLTFTADNVQGGTTVNGIPSKPWALAPQNDKERW
ncbi:MAG: aldo/keto reductase [Pyrinomonadaceae bacterium]|nr:aldo/keto reductase [Phycisphaerales bacterium]